MLGDPAVHQRLGEGRLVDLVVPAAAIADEVDDNVALEAMTIFGGDARRAHDRVHVVAVDVQHRRTDGFRHIGAERRAAAVSRVGGETELVVDDEMDGAARGVSGNAAELQHLGDHALAGEGRIGMHEQAENVPPAFLDRVPALLPCAHAAERDAVDGFEMRGIVAIENADRPAAVAALARVTEVIGHVARRFAGPQETAGCP